MRPTTYYRGPAYESGGTALSIKSPSPGVRYMYGMGKIKKGMRVLDYGAGFGRNAAFLRSLGVDVYAYDPFNADDRKARILMNVYTDKMADFRVSNVLPEGKFDISFTSYVLCVVPKHEQDRIISYLQECTTVAQYHVIVPPRDLEKRIKPMLKKQSQPTWDFYKQYEIENQGSLIGPTNFCTYGVKTSRGFQRSVHISENLRHVIGYAGWQLLSLYPPIKNGE